MSANDTATETESGTDAATDTADLEGESASKSGTETETENDNSATDADGNVHTDGNTDAAADDLELAAQVELLADENRRLREEYVRARRSQYRATAIGLAAVGIVATLGGLLFPDAREVLVALGATGLFGAVLTYYLTPNQFVAADVGERVYTATTANTAAIVDDLGLRDDRVYVPGETDPAHLYVPQYAGYALPETHDRNGPIVVDDDSRGLLLTATGAELFREFERSLTGDLAATPPVLAEQLTDALVEQFELVRSADADVDLDLGGEGEDADDHGRITVAVTDSTFGDVDRFDHPVASFLAVGVAAGLERPVTLEVTPSDERADWLVTCRWERDGRIGADDSRDTEATNESEAEGDDTDADADGSETVQYEEQ